MVEEDDDNGTVVEGRWVRKYGYVSEFDIDARWVLYYPNDERPHGSLRVVSHPDLPPGHLKSFVSIITKRWPKTKDDFARTFQNYGLLNDNDMYFFNGTFFKEKTATTYYVYNNVIYKNKKLSKVNNKLVASYLDPTNKEEIFANKIYQQTPLVGDEFSVVVYSNPFTDGEIQSMLRSLSNELEAYNINENVETWDNEVVDKMRNIEKLYNIKIFE